MSRPGKKSAPRSGSRLFLFYSICLFLFPVSAVPAADSVFLEDLTWIELKDQIQAGKKLIIVPIGGTEQNGPAMALGKHNARVTVLSEKIARNLGDALVAPVLKYVPEGGLNPPTEHMRFPGTISVPPEVFRKTLDSIARSLKLHGFRDIVFLGDHGGYQKDLATVAERLTREWRTEGTRVHAIKEYYRAGDSDFAQQLKQRGYSNAEIGTHAGLADTSLTLALDPSQVRPDRLAAGKDLDRTHGVSGDPRRSSIELGQIGVETIVTRTVAAIKKAIARN